MNHEARSLRLSGYLIIIGAIGMGIATLFHPLLVDPFNGVRAFHGYAKTPYWIADHIAMLLSISLWLIGLMGGSSFIISRSVLSKKADLLLGVSLALWLTILVAELTMIPVLGEKLKLGGSESDFIIWQAVFALSLLLGYIAMAAAWIAIAYYGADLRKGNQGSRMFQMGAFYGGGLGFIGILLTFFNYEWAYFILPPTTIIPFIWSMALGWKMIK
jgi:hypothetical protein